MAGRGSSPIFENRPQEIVPQFRSHRAERVTIPAPVNDAPNLVVAGSDVYLEYIQIRHLTGVAADIGLRAIVDGETYTTDPPAFNAADNTWYWVYIGVNIAEPSLETDAVTRRLAAWDVPWYCHSLRLYSYARQAGVLNLQTVFRLKDL